MFFKLRFSVFLGVAMLAAMLSSASHALDLQRAAPQCGGAPLRQSALPAAAAKRLAESQVAEGSRDIAWAWLTAPTLRYPHKSLGSREHAGAVHVQARLADGRLQDIRYQLPLHRVFEDLVPRLVDLDGDGKDELVLVESDLVRGSALVVLGLRPASKIPNSPNSTNAGKPGAVVLTELARSPFAGGSFLWLNPLGFGDFDGDGRTDLAAVITPHIGGTLTLYHYRPPLLEPFAKAMDVSNHKMGAVEQQLGVVLPPKSPKSLGPPGAPSSTSERSSIIVPDMTRRALHWLQWGADPQKPATQQWKEMSDLMALPARVERITPVQDGACLLMSDGTWWKLVLPQ